VGIEAKESRSESKADEGHRAVTIHTVSREQVSHFSFIFLYIQFDCIVALCEGKLITFALCMKHAGSHSTRASSVFA